MGCFWWIMGHLSFWITSSKFLYASQKVFQVQILSIFLARSPTEGKISITFRLTGAFTETFWNTFWDSESPINPSFQMSTHLSISNTCSNQLRTWNRTSGKASLKGFIWFCWGKSSMPKKTNPKVYHDKPNIF